MFNNKQKVWNQVYKKYKPSELPWYNLKFPQSVIKQLKKLDKNKTMLVPGCGAGETTKILYDMGFKNIIGTDISGTAIKIAEKNFPEINFRRIATEHLCDDEYYNVNIFDWMNLHQISFNDIKHYLSSLQKISNNIILAYIYEPELGETRESYITGDKVYNHDPKSVINMVNKLNLIEKINFRFKINPKFGEKTHKAVGLFFRK